MLRAAPTRVLRAHSSRFRPRATGAGRSGRGRPSTALLAAEAPRATLELAVAASMAPLLAVEKRGDGHPVLVLPGLLGGDPSTLVLRRYLRWLGYAVSGWRLGANVGPTEAVVGGKVKVPTVGGSVMLNIPAGSNTGKSLRLKGRGLLDRRTKQRGDQYVKLKVVLPDNADDKLKEFLESWEAGKAYDPRAAMEQFT